MQYVAVEEEGKERAKGEGGKEGRGGRETNGAETCLFENIALLKQK